MAQRARNRIDEMLRLSGQIVICTDIDRATALELCAAIRALIKRLPKGQSLQERQRVWTYEAIRDIERWCFHSVDPV